MGKPVVETFEISVGNQVRAIAAALARGARVWGGLISVSRGQPGTTYCLEAMATNGERETFYFLSQYNAAWAFLEKSGGNVLVTIQESYVDTGPELLAQKK